MDKVIWKSFRVNDLFEPSNKMMISKVKKLLDVKDTKDSDHSIAIVGASGFNNGITGWLNNSQSEGKEISNVITFSYDAAYSGTAFYQKEKFVTTQNFGTHGALLIKNENLKYILNDEGYQFICKVLIKIFQKNWCYGWNFKIHGETLLREIILLPCLEVAEGEDYIWEEDGKHYTLAVDYIKKLMDEAKELREQKTIRLYEAERKKYEEERKKYEAEYLEEKRAVSWKSFSLDSLFIFDSRNQLSTNKKALDVSNKKDNEHPIALITQSEKNNGVSGFLELNDETEQKRMNNYLTYSMHFGLCFYHDYDFVLMDTHGSVFRLIAKQNELKEKMDENKELNLFLAKTITKVCRNGIYNYSWLPNSTRVGREIILLPCLEVAEGEDYIWEEDGKHYTLATNYISYLYLTGKVNYNQKLIDNYTYQY